jgi:hypothetical protein
MITGMPVESPVRGDVHAGFGGRVGETDQPRGCHRAPARPYTFRFNRRASRRRGLLFYRLLEQAAATGPVAYRDLIATPRPGSRRPTAPTGRRANPASLAGPPADRPWRQPT